MRILTTYVSREFIKLFVLCLMGFLALFFIVDFFEKIDNFHEAGIPGEVVYEYFLLSLPWVASQIMPMAVLMAVILALGIMSKNNELIALKASGVSVLRLCVPLILWSLVLTMVMITLQEFVVPAATRRTNYIWQVLVQGKDPRLTGQRKPIWIKQGQTFFHVKKTDVTRGMVNGLTIYQFDQVFNLVRRIDAQRAVYVGGDWYLHDGLEQILVPMDLDWPWRMAAGSYWPRKFQERRVKWIDFRPSDFRYIERQTEQLTEEMTFPQLARHIAKLRSEGRDPLRFRVELNGKLSFPFVCLILTLLGIPLALWKERGRNLALGVVFGVAGAALYWIFFGAVKVMLGYTGVLPPVWAVWLTNIVFALSAMLMITFIKQ
jgi:lipopolysaccharide export system permease protein